VAAPLLRIAGQLKHIENFRLDRVVRLASPLRELDDLSGVLLQMSRGLASFQKYNADRARPHPGLPRRRGSPRRHQQMLTVMFTDVAGFTGISEDLGDGVVPVLAQYLEAVSTAVSEPPRYDRQVHRRWGMAFWGAPAPNERHAADACAAALECQRLLALQRAEAERRGGTPAANARRHQYRRMLVGNIGSSERLSYTVMGIQ